jgi:UDP-glucuronate decarboxylase
MQKDVEIVRKDLLEIYEQLKDKKEKILGKTFLITGPEGLLGSYLVETILFFNDKNPSKKPAKIIGLQRSGVNRNGRLGHLVGRKNVTFVRHDAIEPYQPKKRVDYIIHSAGRSAPAFFESDPLGTLDINVKGMRWILEYAKENKISSVLYMSSGEIYGNPTPGNVPTPETYNGNVSPLAPRACYAESKRLSETLCNIYYKKFGVPVKIARPFIVYGPGLKVGDRRVMAEFIKSGLEKKPIQMLNGGLDTRCYCYISDATVLFLRLLFSDLNADPINVANNKEEVTIKSLAETVHKLCGIKEKVGVKENLDKSHVVDAPSRVHPNTEKAEKLLKYNPKVPLKEGLKRTIAWNKSLL